MNEFRTRSELIEHSAPVRLGNLAYQAGLGVFQAAMKAQSDGKTVYTFGVYRDQSALSPTTIVASAIATPKIFVKLAEVVMEGAFEPQPYRFTITLSLHNGRR